MCNRDFPVLSSPQTSDARSTGLWRAAVEGATEVVFLSLVRMLAYEGPWPVVSYVSCLALVSGSRCPHKVLGSVPPFIVWADFDKYWL